MPGLPQVAPVQPIDLTRAVTAVLWLRGPSGSRPKPRREQLLRPASSSCRAALWACGLHPQLVGRAPLAGCESCSLLMASSRVGAKSPQGPRLRATPPASQEQLHAVSLLPPPAWPSPPIPHQLAPAHQRLAESLDSAKGAQAGEVSAQRSEEKAHCRTGEGVEARMQGGRPCWAPIRASTPP